MPTLGCRYLGRLVVKPSADGYEGGIGAENMPSRCFNSGKIPTYWLPDKHPGRFQEHGRITGKPLVSHVCMHFPNLPK